MRRITPLVVLSLVAALAGGGGIYLACTTTGGQSAGQQGGNRRLTLKDIPFDGERSYGYLKEICEIGPRISGSEGMARQQKLVREHFEKLGATVEMQEFTHDSPATGRPTTLANMIVRWHPDRRERVLLCAHYDTRPYPDQDPDARRRRDPFLGANDGASGVALLMELGRHMPDSEGKYGVDFVLFDAEEWVFVERRDRYFLGSEHFARHYRDNPAPFVYKYGVVLDMIGDRDLQIYYERNSMIRARDLTKDIWETARRLGVDDFIPRVRHTIRDDHLPLNDIAEIPTTDLIDFDYPHPTVGNRYWHTTSDVPENCSALSLAKVGWVMHEWLKGLQASAD